MADTVTGGHYSPTVSGLNVTLGGYSGSGNPSSGNKPQTGGGNKTTTIDLSVFLTPNVKEYEVKEIKNDLVVEGVNPDKPKSIFDIIGDALATCGATLVVGATSVLSGIADVAEAIVDGGATVVAGAMDLVGLDGAADATREFVKRDWVSEANDALYADGGLLSGVNDASALKYDSDAAQGIRSVSKKVTVFVAATAATVCTGGAASVLVPVALGFNYGAGEKAEELYNTEGIHLSGASKLKILLSGAGEAINWYGLGKMGSQALSFTKGAFSAGFKGIRSNFKTLTRGLQNFDWKSAWSAAKKSATSLTTLKATAAQQAPYVIHLTEKVLDGKEITGEDILGLVGNVAKSYATTVGLSGFGGGLGGGIDKYQHTSQYMEDQGKIYKVSKETIGDYKAKLEAEVQGDVDWEVRSKNGLSKDQWNALTPAEQDSLRQVSGAKELTATKLGDKYKAAGQTIHQYGVQEHAGFYDSHYSVDQVLEAKINKSAGPKSYDGIRNAEYLPNADEFISDERVLDYIKELCPDDAEIAACTNLQEAADVLAKGKTGKFITFQSAGVGDNNVVKFGGNLGYVPDSAGSNTGYEGTKTGGAFMTPAAELERYAKQYPDACKIVDGKFVITDMEAFGENALGGVPLSNASGSYMIEAEVPINGTTVTMPSVNNSSSYMAQFVSGGKLPSGGTETTILPIHLDGISSSGIGGQTGFATTEARGHSSDVPQIINGLKVIVKVLK